MPTRSLPEAGLTGSELYEAVRAFFYIGSADAIQVFPDLAAGLRKSAQLA